MYLTDDTSLPGQQRSYALHAVTSVMVLLNAFLKDCYTYKPESTALMCIRYMYKCNKLSRVYVFKTVRLQPETPVLAYRKQREISHWSKETRLTFTDKVPCYNVQTRDDYRELCKDQPAKRRHNLTIRFVIF